MMKRFLSFIIAVTLALTLSAQSEKYELFKELRNSGDTLSMSRMLSSWGEETPHLYSAWTGYLLKKYELTEDTRWAEKALEWVERGRSKYPDNDLLLYKSLEAYMDTGLYSEADEARQEIISKGFDEESVWPYYVDLYVLKSDLDSAFFYLDKLSSSADEDLSSYASQAREGLQSAISQMQEGRIVPDHIALKKFSRSREYSALLERFKRADTSLTEKELSDIYYAGAFLHMYDGVSSLTKKGEDLYAEGKYSEALTEFKTVLEEYPVSIRALYGCYLASVSLGKEDEGLLFRLRSLLNAISSSGDGISPETPFHVICVDDEYFFLREAFGMEELAGQALTADKQDEMRFVNDYGLEQKSYFELSPAYWEKIEGLLK